MEKRGMERYIEFDIYALVLSFMVVMIHSSYTNLYPSNEAIDFWINDVYCNYLSGFAVPMFFMISGIKFYRGFAPNQTKQKIASRFRTILIPFLLWNTISVIWNAFLSYTPFLSAMISTREKFIFSLKNLIGGIFWFKYIHPFWFMALLFIFVLLCPIIYFVIRKKIVFGVVLLSLYLAQNLLPMPQTHWPMFQVNTIIYCVAFYLIGAFLGLHHFHWFVQKKSRVLRWPAAFVFLLMVTMRCVLNDSKWIFIPTILIGGYALWGFCGSFKMKDCGVLHDSFFIYPAHTFILPCVNKVLYLILPNEAVMGIINTIGGTIISFALCLIVAEALKHTGRASLWNLLNGRRAL